MPAFRFVGSMLLRSGETFLYTLKAGPAGGRLRRPSSRRRRRHGHREIGLTYRSGHSHSSAAYPLVLDGLERP
jgi:hypothetical protein